MYFVIIGRERKLAMLELQSVCTCKEVAEHIVLTEQHLDFGRLGGAVKRGRVVTEQDLAHELADVELVGSADMELAKLAKRQFAPRRYKTFKLLHTDKEVSTKGKELVAIGDGQIGIVDGWQDIDRYEVIDFGKPVRGMEIGMMPAKLTQTLVNIGVSQVHKVHDEDVSLNTTIYDPFCGFGTTLFVANSLGYNAIGSDENAQLVKENLKWWPSTAYATDAKMTTFKHDATTPFTKPFLQYVDVVVSEGWLGPVVYENTHSDALEQHMRKVLEVYIAFLTRIRESISAPIVMTLPSYTRLPLDTIAPNIAHIAKFSQQEIHHIGRYARKGQFVQREILLVK